MSRRTMLTVLVLAITASPASGQEEAKATSRIVSVGLFKIGLALVKREVHLTGPGTYRLDATPDAVHGTFWVESNDNVEVALRMREVEVDNGQYPVGMYQQVFQGKKVTVHLKGNKMAPVTGTVPKLTLPKELDDPLASHRMATTIERAFVVKTAKGLTYIDPSEIAAVEVEEDGAKLTQRKPVLVLTVSKGQQKPVVYLTYLSSGLAWAPSYRVDISDRKSLSIEMAAVLRNEMADFADAEVSLISGFPSVEFANVSSPLTTQSNWAKFFQEVSQRGGRQDSMLNINLASNTFRPSAGERVQLPAAAEGEGVDLHFESIGKRDLLLGEALSLSIAKAKADYERVVEWTVGGGHDGRKRGESLPDEIWDVLNFKNPFKFPLTTAPAMVIENGRFNGQRTCFWTNVGEETTVRITKSLSIRTLCTEVADKTKQPEQVAIGRTNYLRLYLKGELVVNNHRKEPVKMHIAYSINGDVTNADSDPRIVPRSATLTDINPTRDVLWIVTLQPGEEKKLAYSYSTLVDR